MADLCPDKHKILGEVSPTDSVESRFRGHLRTQTTLQRHRGRLAIFFLDPSGTLKAGRILNFDPSSNDQANLASLLNRDGMGPDPVQVLWILEDLAAVGIECLHSITRIPLSVFALHWANPMDNILGKERVPLGVRFTENLMLNYVQTLPWRIQNKVQGRVFCHCQDQRFSLT